MEILLWAIPFFFLTMVVEWRMTLDEDVRGYWWKDTGASLSMGIGNLVVMFGAKLFGLAIFLAPFWITGAWLVIQEIRRGRGKGLRYHGLYKDQTVD